MVQRPAAVVILKSDFPRHVPASEQPVFEPGQLIRHRPYGYRGVVVDRDEFCQADDEWYLKNQTRDQPWYHGLVDGSSTCTYELLQFARFG